jgi:hypothetical protein
LPVTLLAVWLGRIVNQYLHGDAFLKYVHAGLIVTGALLLIQSIGG